MNKIEILEKKLDEANQMLNLHKSILIKEPDNFAYKLSLVTVEEHITDIQNQLRLEKKIRDREILKLNLTGTLAQEGSIPLSILADLSQFISQAILSASRSLKYGERLKGRIPKEIIDTLDLRFAGISAGSTHIFITGKTSPDLFGRSLLESCLENTFDLLSSERPEKLSEVISKIGIRSAKKINEFLRVLTNSELDLELIWESPSEAIYEWKGTKENMLSLSNSLETIKREKPIIIDFEGELIMASTKGQFEILDVDKNIYKGIFPDNLLNDIKKLHIGQFCEGKIEKKMLVNIVTGYRKIFYALISIRPEKENHSLFA